jgi:hypothetical protein
VKRQMALIIWLQNRNETHGVTIDKRFSTILPWRNPKNNFSYPENPLPMKTLTGQKELKTGRGNSVADNRHENLFSKNARIFFFCGRQNVRFWAMHAA